MNEAPLSIRIRLIGVLLGAILLIACAGPQPEPPAVAPPSFRLAVLDFRVPDLWLDALLPDKARREMHGWWFGARDVWRNPGMGRVAADLFAHELNRLPFVHMVSRVDIKYYMANKRDLIRTKLEERRLLLEQSENPRDRDEARKIRAMTEADLERQLAQLCTKEAASGVGRELKTDRILVGQIHNIALNHNRTIHWFWSTVDLEVDLVDVDSGRVVWHKRAQFSKNFASTSLLLEIAARQMVEMMKREYFYQP